MTTQEFFQERVEFIAGAEGYLLLTDYTWANVGVWRFYTPDDYAFMFEIRFDFRGAHIDLSWVGIKTTWSKNDLDQALGHLHEFVCARA